MFSKYPEKNSIKLHRTGGGKKTIQQVHHQTKRQKNIPILTILVNSV